MLAKKYRWELAIKFPKERSKILYLKGGKIIYVGGFQISDEFSVQIN